METQERAATIDSIDAIKQKYKPIGGYTVYVFKSNITSNYVASIYRETEVNRFKKEYADATVGQISTPDFNKFFKFVSQYLQPRA